MRDPKKIELDLSEPVARYVLALLDVDDYEHSPNDYETAELRRSIAQQITRAQQHAPQTGGSMPDDFTTQHERVAFEQSRTAIAVQSSELIIAVIEQTHACY